MNRKVTVRLWNNLNNSIPFYPAASRAILTNDREAPDWDYYTSTYPLERGTAYAGNHMFQDAVPNTNNPDLTWKLNDCSDCFDNKKAAIYDRPAHANGTSVGTALHGKIMVSIHFDMGSTDGPVVYVQDPTINSTVEQKDHSVALATPICQRLYTLRFGGSSTCSTRVLTGNYAVLRELFNTLTPGGHAFPAILIEVANLNSANDQAWLGTGAAQDARLNEIADAIYNGIVDWYNANN